MHFTRTPSDQKKPVNIGTNNMGKYYNNVRVPIKNNTTATIAKRIDKNMINLGIPIINPTSNPIINQKDVTLKMLQLSNPIIENVYQVKYNTGESTGLGDFIRGSYFLMQFCESNNIHFNINILNHPISQFFEKRNSKSNNMKSNNGIIKIEPISNDGITFESISNNEIINNINKFEHANHNPQVLDNGILTNIYDHTINDKFIQYLGRQCVLNKKLYVYTITYPTENIEQRHKEYMKHILAPTEQITLLTDKMLLNLEITKNQFTIIHIRYGDTFLVDKKGGIKNSHFNIIQNTLDNLDQSRKYLLISDNIIMKHQINLRYPFIKMHFNQITHTNGDDNNRLQNTMIDFCLFSHAEKVIAFSVYKHGTGFSRWAAETHSVPYSCTLLP
jgi:hypothetical protein